ncbi:hypothetical protein V8C35DRAFT_312100 [Trichoderma chlorosporum]
MMPGSTMPKMINVEPYHYPSKEELLITGLRSVYVMGLPCYSALRTPREETPLLKLCVPTNLADNSFVEDYTPLRGTEWSLPELLNIGWPCASEKQL